MMGERHALTQAAIPFGLPRARGDGEDGVRYVTTLPGRGYCFAATLSGATAASRALDGGSTSKQGASSPGLDHRDALA
jgi:DNA-binding winged helix-turn-helix (wHTH) protein